MENVAEMLSPGRDDMRAPRIRRRPARRRRLPDLRAVVTGMALFVAVAWTIVFGVGVVLR
jgi:hypothetical protein